VGDVPQVTSLNFVHGLSGDARDVGSEIVSHPDVAAVSFIGGTATGKLIASNAAPHFKKVVLPSPPSSHFLRSLSS
jgi:acyl-CoA reductase-like NAD-dependent aldehyde dehydrogenase